MKRRIAALAAVAALAVAADAAAGGAPVKTGTSVSESEMTSWSGAATFLNVEVQGSVVASGSRRARIACFAGRTVELVKASDTANPIARVRTDNFGRFTLSGTVGPPQSVQVRVPAATKSYKIAGSRHKTRCAAAVGSNHPAPTPTLPKPPG